MDECEPLASGAAAVIRTAYGQQQVKELGKAGEIDQPPDLSKDQMKSLFNKLTERAEVGRCRLTPSNPRSKRLELSASNHNMKNRI